jgi:hypothetical protein
MPWDDRASRTSSSQWRARGVCATLVPSQNLLASFPTSFDVLFFSFTFPYGSAQVRFQLETMRRSLAAAEEAEDYDRCEVRW